MPCCIFLSPPDSSCINRLFPDLSWYSPYKTNDTKNHSAPNAFLLYFLSSTIGNSWQCIEQRKVFLWIVSIVQIIDIIYKSQKGCLVTIEKNNWIFKNLVKASPLHTGSFRDTLLSEKSDKFGSAFRALSNFVQI